MENKSAKFEEVEHWLTFIKKWEQETQEPIPDQAILSLEVAFDKLLYNYRNSNHPLELNDRFKILIH
jgi:hypothetical protein